MTRHTNPSTDAGSVPVRAVEAAAEVLAGFDGYHESTETYKVAARDGLQAALDTGEMVTASFDGLLAILDRHYPADVFTGSSGDVGVRLVVLARELAAVREERDRLAERLQRIEAAIRDVPAMLSVADVYRDHARLMAEHDRLREAARAVNVEFMKVYPSVSSGLGAALVRLDEEVEGKSHSGS